MKINFPDLVEPTHMLFLLKNGNQFMIDIPIEAKSINVSIPLFSEIESAYVWENERWNLMEEWEGNK